MTTLPDPLHAHRDHHAAVTWLVRENRRAGQIYTRLVGRSADRQWHGTALDAIAAAGQPVHEGRPA